MTGNRIVAVGAIFAFIAIALGAFAAHGLAERLPEAQLTIFRTGAQYQIYQALALVLLGLWCNQQQTQATGVAGCWIAGIFLFSGSLYALALSGIRVLGAITPLGGLLFLGGWLGFAFRALRSP